MHYPKMPKETQKTASWYVRNYPRFILEREAILHGSKGAPEVPSGGFSAGDPVGTTVVKLEKVTNHIKAIETARASLPDEYRQGVWCYCVLRSKYPSYANIKTWKAYTNDFLYRVALELGLPFE